jgi:hypothetical protein
MGTKAYFMINMEKRFSDDGYYLDAIRELEAMPEVETVNPVSGMCDLLVKVDAPIRMIFVANKIRVKKWVKSLHVLKVEPSEAEKVSEVAAPDMAKT